MKKFLCMFVLCAMLLSLLPTVVVAEDASAVLQGEELAIESVISDGTVWTYEDLTYPSLWLGDGSTAVQVSSSVYTKVDTKGIGVAARLATPSTLTGFVLTLDGTAGKESWKSRMNTVKLYASVDGTDWTEVGAVSGVTDGQAELTVSVASTDTTTVYHFVAFYQPESVGSFRFCGIKAYGDPVAMPRLYGSQISTVYTKDGADYYSIRFVSTVDTVDLDHVGYRISVLDSTQKIVRQYTTQVTKVQPQTTICASPSCQTPNQTAETPTERGEQTATTA